MLRRRTITRCLGLLLERNRGQVQTLDQVPSPLSATISRRQLSQGATVFRGPLSFLSLALAMATGIGCLYFYEDMKEKKLQSKIPNTKTSVGAAAVGGPFSLIDHNGKRFKSDDLKDEFSLLYFGFTQCPDVCPEELDKITEAVKQIKTEAGTRINSVFVTLDPERDGPKLVKSYIREFDNEMIGLTGSRKEINQAARAFRVYHSKANEYDDDYLIDHSIITYLLDPESNFLTFYGKNFTSEELAKSVMEHMRSWAADHAEYRKQHPKL